MQKSGFVYIMSNRINGVLYVGVTSNLVKRVYEHREHTLKGCFTDKYKCNKLVWFKEFSTITNAITSEKILKKGARQKKINLINESNPEWKDLWEIIE